MLASIVAGGLLVTYLEVAQVRPLGQASGVWGLIVATALYVGVSFVTKAPERGATEFIGYLSGALKDKGTF